MGEPSSTENETASHPNEASNAPAAEAETTMNARSFLRRIAYIGTAAAIALSVTGCTAEMRNALPVPVRDVLGIEEPSVWPEDWQKRWGVIDMQGNWTAEPIRSRTDMHYCLDGNYIPTVRYDEQTAWAKLGYMDSDGNWKIEPQFSEAGTFNEYGVAAVTQAWEDGGACGYIKKDGSWAIEPRFLDIGYYPAEGTAPARDKETGLWGTIDKDGAWVIEPFCGESFGTQLEGGIFYSYYVQDEAGEWHAGIQDWQGMRLTEAVFDKVLNSNDPDHIPASTKTIARETEWYYVDTQGERTGAQVYRALSAPNEQGLAVAKDESDAEFVIDVATEQKTDDEVSSVRDRPRFDEFADKALSDGSGDVVSYDAAAQKWGIRDASGQWIVQARFEQIKLLDGDDGWLGATLDESEGWGYIDKSGAWMIEPQAGRSSLGAFADNGLARAAERTQDGEESRYGFIDRSGVWLIEPKFVNAYPFASCGLARAEDPETELWGYLDETGAWAIEPQFNLAYDFMDNGRACVEIPRA